MSVARFSLFLGLCWSVGAPALAADTPAAPCAFSLKIKSTGVYRLDFAMLEAAMARAFDQGAALPLRSSQLHLTQGGKTVPIWIEDGGDGRFGPGDFLHLVGRAPQGDQTFFDEKSEWNVYRLDACGPLPTEAQGLARVTLATRPESLPPLDHQRLRISDHLEENHLLLRFNQSVPEQWYWLRLTHADGAAREFPIDLQAHRKEIGPVALEIDLRGWSYQSGRRHGLPDHQIQVFWNDQPVGTWEWDGQEAFRIDLEAINPEIVLPGRNRLSLRIPERKIDTGESIVDVVLLNWIKLDFPRRPVLLAPQQRIALAPSSTSTTVMLRHANDAEVIVYDDQGNRWDQGNQEVDATEAIAKISFAVPGAATELIAVRPEAVNAVPQVEVDLPSNLRDPNHQADYLMIVHPSLRPELERLAEFHRGRGLRVELVDIRDIYDEFSHGMPYPEAIHTFISHAYHSWQAPAPRFVLLAGDASWDTQNDEAADENYADWTYQPGEIQNFLKNASTPYADGVKERNLIPAWGYESHQGRAAGDNFFVTVAGDDNLPDLAIGRIPVVEPADLRAVVDKTIRYGRKTQKVGPWRRRMLWITNDELGFQHQTESLIAASTARGFEAMRVFPRTDEPSNERHQEALRAAFDTGQQLVHFYGHGGRYIWRTGPPDLRKNHDLFTLDDLDKLAPTENLPVVLSMSCYSAPFDHPTADSIGEKFLRIADRGAIGVIAASWRNAPALDFSQNLVEFLTTPGVSMGEALRRAKSKSRNASMIEQYNLLGDPAIEMALPILPIELASQTASDGTIELSGQVRQAEDFSGEALVEWLDANGKVLADLPTKVESGRLVSRIDGALKPWEVRVYAWDSSRNLDGLALLKLDAPQSASTSSASTANPTPTSAGPDK